ncbi:putative O-glycosylation ligase, exosortase A system-associated [Sphingomonas paeninsulae]|uniref:Putative O-glycosylation ligase, exosortase A system-associated n=1 Tax=Sphingomonas paeninsulae TaxID=2319844 RepID=A0A494TJP3_SPHPE|nr:putative O-glycosylation ligase, exosortase A system-associated [Sphingomonas paeninsulae]AYJ86036.1 putative O-glycosylation ligase, exosortase A system-associated [Sphingomonas paeninsulae]
MRDLAFVGFLLALIGMGFRRPFLFVLAYVYVDIVSPQRLTYILLNSVPISLILVSLAVGSWALFDDKRDTRVTPRQVMLLMLLVYCGITTTQADFPLEAADKWSWVWKALAFAIFLPLTLRTRLRIESLVLFMVLSAASIIIVGGIKTAAGGGGYGSLNLMMDSNSGLYEGSILSTVAIAIIPLIAWLARYGTIYVPDWRVRLFAAALIFACLLIPVGTQARTGLICIGVLGVTFLRQTKRRVLYLGGLAAVALVAIPMLPASFTTRMNTIQGYQADSSASTRIAVWQWTLGYVKDHPYGGGFEAYRQNKLRIVKHATVTTGEQQDVSSIVEYDQARAYHSAYFEMLGEQGYPGLVLWLVIHLSGLFRMEVLRTRYRKSQEDGWIASLAIALQQGHLIYLIGSLFVGIAFQPFVYMLVGLQIGLDTYAARRAKEAQSQPGFGSVRKAVPQPS